MPKQEELARLLTRGWVTLPQMARIAGVSYQTMLAMRDRGQIRCIKVGGWHRVYTDEVCRFLISGNYLDEGLADRIMKENIRQ